MAGGDKRGNSILEQTRRHAKGTTSRWAGKEANNLQINRRFLQYHKNAILVCDVCKSRASASSPFQQKVGATRDVHQRVTRLFMFFPFFSKKKKNAMFGKFV